MTLGVSVMIGGSQDDELSAASVVEVVERMGETTTFRLRYPLNIDNNDFPLLTDDRVSPGSVISILVPGGSEMVSLVKGPVRVQRCHFVHGGAGSYVDVEGSDSSIKMDREDRAAVWDSNLDSDSVSTVIANYGLNDDVDATDGHHDETKHTLVQRSSDLAFVRLLAQRNGFVFWITSDKDGNETAHFKRPPFDADPALTLTINLDTPSLDNLDLDWDVERPTSSLAAQLNLNDLSTIDGEVDDSPLALLGASSLVAITGDTRSVHLIVPADDSGDLRARSESVLLDATTFVHVACQTTMGVVPTPIRTHTVIKLDGLGSRHSGKYFVSSVRHTINELEHRMESELVRNAWGAT
ncbi:MAG TPA: hypothetical protein VMT95_12710 [Candidatus Binatia bacterium]|nr:hypothetical protein [Candidatus Binatia bacterium]